MLGTRLREARRAQALSAADVVAQLRARGYAITDRQLAAYEADRRLPERAVLLKLGEILRLFEATPACSPQELLTLPQEERESILALAAAAAERDYRDDSDLINFEAFGDDDLHDATP